ncbi:MAG: hypothetical protein RLZZ597_3733 [Cyanobacteriota bacterium]
MAESPLPSSPSSGWGVRLAQTLAPQRWLGPVAMLGPAGLWLLLLLVFPTVLILEISLVPGLRLGQPAGGYGLGNYLQILQPVYLRVMGRSLAFALGSTLLCLGLGFPVAYWLALMSPKRWRNLLVVAFILPLWTSSLLRAYAWITILRPSGVLNRSLASLASPIRTG